jgi:hypothetical protein
MSTEMQRVVIRWRWVWSAVTAVALASLVAAGVRGEGFSTIIGWAIATISTATLSFIAWDTWKDRS